MAYYKYEPHLHTKEASACAILTGAEQARLYKDLGYSGIIVTDHFFNGNTCIPKHLPWSIKLTCYAKDMKMPKKKEIKSA